MGTEIISSMIHNYFIHTSQSFIGTGDTRGDLFIAKFYYKISPNVTGHVLFEHFIPGDYYFDGANVSNWARLEVLYSCNFI